MSRVGTVKRRVIEKIYSERDHMCKGTGARENGVLKEL